MRLPVPVVSVLSARAKNSDVPDFASVPCHTGSTTVCAVGCDTVTYKVGRQLFRGHSNTGVYKRVRMTSSLTAERAHL